MPAKKKQNQPPPLAPRDVSRVVPGGVGNSPVDDLRSMLASSPGAIIQGKPSPYDWGNPLPVQRPASGANPPAPVTGMQAGDILSQASVYPVDDGVEPPLSPEEEADINRELARFEAELKARRLKRKY